MYTKIIQLNKTHYVKLAALLWKQGTICSGFSTIFMVFGYKILQWLKIAKVYLLLFRCLLYRCKNNV